MCLSHWFTMILSFSAAPKQIIFRHITAQLCAFLNPPFITIIRSSHPLSVENVSLRRTLQHFTEDIDITQHKTSRAQVSVSKGRFFFVPFLLLKMWADGTHFVLNWNIFYSTFQSEVQGSTVCRWLCVQGGPPAWSQVRGFHF